MVPALLTEADRAKSWLAAGLAFVLAASFLPAEIRAQPTSNELRSHSTRPPLRQAPPAQRPVDRHRAQIEQRRANRHLVSPLGSAANARPGYYSQRLNQPIVHTAPHVPFHGYAAPYVVYVDPSPREPVVAGEAPAYQPPPIYIVQPQAAPTPVITQPAPIFQPEPEPRRPVEPPRPRPTAPQGVTVSVFPADAVVFLDDEPMGTAASLGALTLRPGVYVLEVSHPDHPDQRLVFGVEDEPLTISIDLTADRPSRRSRVK